MSDEPNYTNMIKLELQIADLQSHLTQRTAELEAVTKERDGYDVSRRQAYSEIADLQVEVKHLQAELERVRGELVWANQCRQDAAAMTEHLTSEVTTLREQNRVLASLLAKAQPHVCSMLCPSVKREGDPWTHKDLCTHITAALTATSQEGQG